MRAVLIAAAVLLAAPAFAQTPEQAPAPKHRHAAHPPTGGVERPIDNGPNTPEANRAYQGGGVILEGQPGGPAPSPQPTPPGQLPRNSVPR